MSAAGAGVMAYGAHAASHSVVGAVRDAAWLAAALAWVLCVIGGGAILELVCPPGNAEDLVRARLGRHAHAAGICLCVAAMVATRSTVLLPVVAVQVALAVWYWRRTQAAAATRG